MSIPFSSPINISDTAANADLVLANVTTATSSTTNASPLIELAANYWNGSASAQDTWTIGSSLAAGTNGASTLIIAQSGSTGTAAIQVPNLLQLNPTVATALTTNASPIHTLAANYWNGSASAVDSWTIQSSLGAGTNGVASLTIAHTGSTGVSSGGVTISAQLFANNFTVGTNVQVGGGFAQKSSFVQTWQNSSNIFTGAVDTSLSRLSAGTLAIGTTGTAGDYTGSLQLGALSQVNGTVATVSTTNASPLYTLSANYWNGSASAVDSWTIQSSLAAGANGASTLTLAHSGSTGAATIAMPAVTTSVSVTCGTAMQMNGSNFYLGLNKPIGWNTNNSIATGSIDTSISRSSSGVLAIGTSNGYGDYTGGLKLTTLNILGALTDNSASTGTSGQVLTAGTGGQVKWAAGGGSTAITAPFTQYAGTNAYSINNYKIGTANHIAVFPFQLPYAQTITNMSISVASGTTNAIDWGVYSTSGTLLGHVGAQTSTVGVMTAAVSGGAITIGPGTFLFGITCNGTATFWNATYAYTYGFGAIFVYDTGTTSTSGVLPSSVTLTSTTPTSTVLPATTQWQGTGAIPVFMFT